MKIILHAEPGHFLSPSNHTTDHQVIIVGREGVVRCPDAFLGNPQVNITWRKNPGLVLLVEGNEFTFRDIGRELVIRDVTTSHAGNYTCYLNKVECAASKNRSINVSVVEGVGELSNCPSRSRLSTTALEYVVRVMVESNRCGN